MVTIGSTGAAIICAALLLPAVRGRAADLYVSPRGNDRWSGRLAAPNRVHTDGPFATVARARQAVRDLRKKPPELRRPLTVALRGGTYFLAQPLVFTPDDSGTSDSPTVYAAYPGEKPIVSGGTRLTGWAVDQAGRWTLTIPAAARGEWNFAQLFVGGARRYRPRLPKEGYYSIAAGLPPSAKNAAVGFDRLQFRPGDIHAGWHNLGDIEVLGFQIWTMARLRIESVDEAASTVQFTGTTRGTDSQSSIPTGNRYLVENVREALERPGEWYLDRKTGQLTYLARPGENPVKTEVIAPRHDRLVEIRADPAGHRWVEHISFRGIGFEHANWNAPPQGNAYPQAEINLGAAITAIGARECKLEQCTISHVGEYAIALGAGCKQCVIDACELTDMGGGGIKIGTEEIAQDSDRVASNNTVRNCLIAHGGRMHPAAIGVWIGQSPYNTIAHNEIVDFYYTGISVGWTWGYGPSNAHHNLLEYNHIHQIGQGVLSDMGGTYTLGISPGSIQRYNRIHDIESFSYGGWGIYFDEGTTGMVAENNLVYRTKSAGFHQHYGKENILRNNIFAFGREAQLIRTRAEDHLSFTFEHNIVDWKTGSLLGSDWSGNQYRMDYNLYWNMAGKPVTFGGMDLAAWQAKGHDVHSLIADPLFENPASGDFRLRPGSPATKSGFKPIHEGANAGRRRGMPGVPAGAVPPAFPISASPNEQ